jgi:hypothetical protein
MPPYGLYSLTDRVNLPEELAAEGYRNIGAFSPGLDSDFRQSLYQYDPAFGKLNATQRYLAAPYTGANPFQAMFDISPTYFEGTNIGQLPYDIPSYGGVSGYRDTGGIIGEPVRYSADFDTSYGVANEEDEEQVEYLPGQEPSGIEKLFSKVRDIYGTGRDLIGQGISSAASFLTGNPLVGGVMSLMSRMKTPMSEYQMRDLQRRGFGPKLQSIYGPGGIMQGYNPVSMFGRGPLESIINRRNKAKSEAIRNKLNEEITKLGGSTDTNLSAYRASRPASERRSTGPAGGGRDNTGGDRGARGASDSFSNRSGMGRTGY